MTEKFPRGRTAIVSTATYGMGEAPGLQSIDLLAHASIAALAKVGLTPADVDGAFTGLPFDLISGLSVPEYFGIHPRITDNNRSEEHMSELQSLMRISYAVFCLTKKTLHLRC